MGHSLVLEILVRRRSECRGGCHRHRRLSGLPFKSSLRLNTIPKLLERQKELTKLQACASLRKIVSL